MLQEIFVRKCTAEWCTCYKRYLCASVLQSGAYVIRDLCTSVLQSGVHVIIDICAQVYCRVVHRL
jgi:hypothetical protein